MMNSITNIINGDIYVGRRKLDKSESPHRMNPMLIGVSRSIGPDGIADCQEYTDRKQREEEMMMGRKIKDNIVENYTLGPGDSIF